MTYDLYIITDEAIAGGRTHAAIADQATAGGADVIQLRDKRLGCRDLIRIGKQIREITRKSGTLFIVNDRLDVALACGADGVHLGQGDLSPGVARQLAPDPGFIIGVSVGSTQEAMQAETNGADYVALSPVFSTTSKPDAGSGHGLDLLREIRSNISIPLIAIGGITRDNIGPVIYAGADGAAVISAVVSRKDIAAAAHELKTMIVTSKQERDNGT